MISVLDKVLIACEGKGFQQLVNREVETTAQNRLVRHKQDGI